MRNREMAVPQRWRAEQSRTRGAREPKQRQEPSHAASHPGEVEPEYDFSENQPTTGIYETPRGTDRATGIGL